MILIANKALRWLWRRAGALVWKLACERRFGYSAEWHAFPGWRIFERCWLGEIRADERCRDAKGRPL